MDTGIIDSEKIIDSEGGVAVEEKVDTQENAAESKIIMPFEYGEDEHYYVEDLGDIPSKPVYRFFKRCMDILLSIIGLIVAAIPMLIVAILVKTTSKGSVFYKQERLGLNGKPFMLVKFRTMIQDAERDGARWSLGGEDNRITKIGSILRATRLDELPQLWACLTGTLSIVGPRPERAIFYDKFEEHIHGFRQRLKVKPGLTGLAQINGGYDLRPEEKIVFDVEYIKNRSIWQDIKIIFGTVAVVLGRRGAK